MTENYYLTALTALRKDERQIKYGLELRKKDAQINAIKAFNDFSKKIQPISKNKTTDKLNGCTIFTSSA